MGEPRTIRLAGSGTDTQQYELAPGLVQYVQAVRVTMDNTAGADATPVLSVSEQSGVVIADVPQSGVIPAGEADGAATWALRLLGEAKRGGGGVTGLEFIVASTGTVIGGGNSANLNWGHHSGDVLLDLSTLNEPTVIAAGMYAFTTGCLVTASPGPITNGSVMYGALVFDDFSIPAGVSNQIPFSNVIGTANEILVTAVRTVGAGTGIHWNADNAATGSATFQLTGYVARLS